MEFADLMQQFLDEYRELVQKRDDGYKLLDGYIQSIARRLDVPIVEDRIDMLRSIDAAIDALKK